MGAIPILKLIFGVGNPDKKYQNTYHNVGYFAIKLFKENSALTAKIAASDTNMNQSGKSLRKIIKNSNIKPEEILVAQDDSDLFIGEYKLSFNRGSAGHKGIENIIKTLGTKAFWRLRIGIRPRIAKGRKRLKAGDFVLKTINVKNKEQIEKTIKTALQSL